MTGESLQDPDLHRALGEDPPDLGRIRQLVCNAYNAEAKEPVGADAAHLTQEETARVARWLRRAEVEGTGAALLHRRYSFLAAALYPDLASKVNTIAQQRCPACGLDNESGFPVITIPIRISPRSRQAKGSHVVTAYKRALAHGLNARGHNFEDRRLCVRLVFVVAPRRRDDVDNLAKATLDAFEGYFYDNDGQIDHLSLVRIVADGDEEMISVHIAPTNLNGHRDVMDTRFRVGWGGQEALDLEDFLPG